jgi:hypothetical protein
MPDFSNALVAMLLHCQVGEPSVFIGHPLPPQVQSSKQQQCAL